jgi:hypothetical protein
VPQERRTARTPPVVFDDATWVEDMKRATAAGRRAAMGARAENESAGVPIDELRACDPEGPHGTQLKRCMKVYVPAPAGPHGMVLQIGRKRDGKLALSYLAFGLRHPARDMRQPSVYEIAHRRLHQGSGG